MHYLISRSLLLPPKVPFCHIGTGPFSIGAGGHYVCNHTCVSTLLIHPAHAGMIHDPYVPLPQFILVLQNCDSIRTRRFVPLRGNLYNNFSVSYCMFLCTLQVLLFTCIGRVPG